MSAPLRVTTMPRLAPGFTGTPSGRCWVTRCRACAAHGAIIARSAALNRPGWLACLAAAHHHITKHQEGGRI